MTMTKARIGPPPSGKKTKQRLQMTLPQAADIPDNLSVSNEDVAFLNFKVPTSLKTQFKGEAAARNWSMRRLLEASFREFLERNGHANTSGELYVRTGDLERDRES